MSKHELTSSVTMATEYFFKLELIYFKYFWFMNVQQNLEEELYIFIYSFLEGEK